MRRLLFASLLILTFAFIASISQAVNVLPGDLLVASQDTNAIVRAELPSGETVIYQGTIPERFSGIAIGEDGRIFVIGSASSSVRRVSEIDPTTGSVRVVTEISVSPLFGIAIEDDGSLLITDSISQVLRIDPDSGSSSVVTSGGNVTGPLGIVLDDLGDIYLSDTRGGADPGQIIRVDHLSGAQTVISSGGLLSGELRELVFDANGDLLVVDRSRCDRPGRPRRTNPHAW